MESKVGLLSTLLKQKYEANLIKIYCADIIISNGSRRNYDMKYTVFISTVFFKDSASMLTKLLISAIIHASNTLSKIEYLV